MITTEDIKKESNWGIAGSARLCTSFHQCTFALRMQFKYTASLIECTFQPFGSETNLSRKVERMLSPNDQHRLTARRRSRLLHRFRRLLLLLSLLSAFLTRTRRRMLAVLVVIVTALWLLGVPTRSLTDMKSLPHARAVMPSLTDILPPIIMPNTAQSVTACSPDGGCQALSAGVHAWRRPLQRLTVPLGMQVILSDSVVYGPGQHWCRMRECRVVSIMTIERMLAVIAGMLTSTV